MSHKFGLVIYRHGKEPGSLIAEWANEDDAAKHSEIGTGLATRKSSSEDRFAGEYVIEYWIADQTVTLDLTIEKQDLLYQLSWFIDGEMTNSGFGFVSDDALIAGFSR